jgi:hypothetical protein
MIEIVCQESDDPEFTSTLNRFVQNVLDRYRPESVVVVQIKNWFGPRWFKFSGKMLGALGVRKEPLTVPPFIPARVLSEAHFRRTGARYVPEKAKTPLHICQRSSSNLQRRVANFGPKTAFVWYSSGSEGNGRASLMSYLPTSASHRPLYLQFGRTSVWKVVQFIGVGGEELRELLEERRVGPVA